VAPDPLSRWCIAVANAIGVALLWTVAIASGGGLAFVAAALLQAASTFAIVWNLPRRRGLAAALSLSVPVVGPIAATLAVTVSGHRNQDLLRDPLAETRRGDGPSVDGPLIVDALVGALPACEAVLSTNHEIRRASLARLARRATASDLAILRWARAQSSGETAVEIALVLEDVVARFETRASTAQAAASCEADYETRAHAFRVLVDGICSGLVDEPVIEQLATEARLHHDAAIAADPQRAHELFADRARLELALDRPEVVLEMITPLLRTRADDDLVSLYKQAAYSARRFELAAELKSRRSRANDRA
jgi:hypothetical protein